MSGDNISQISGSPYSPRRVNPKNVAGGQGKANESSGDQHADVTRDTLDITGAPQAPQESEAKPSVSQHDMDRYLTLLNGTPDDAGDDKVLEVQEKIARGDYGSDALKGTVQALLEDLGIPPA